MQNQLIGYKRRKLFLAWEPNLDCFSFLQRRFYLCCCEQQCSRQVVCCSVLTGRLAFLKIVISLPENAWMCFYSDFLKILGSEAHFPCAFIYQTLSSLPMIMCLIYFMINQNLDSNTKSEMGLFHNLSSNSTALAMEWEVCKS